MSATDYHVLMVLTEQDLYGYAIMKALDKDSHGAISPEMGSLYGILARLVTEGCVEEVEAPEGAPSEHRGRPRRYYRLTNRGGVTLDRETLRLESVLRLARERRRLPVVRQ